MSEQTDLKNRVEELFHEAQARRTGEARAAYLDGACEGDPELRSEVEALLSAGQQADSYLEKPAAIAETITSSSDPSEGSEVGNYKLLQQLGEGGFGIVYMAQQTQPIKRQVAIKIIKPGMDSKEVIARFEAERQALAMMDHPNIAKVLDAGTTSQGRPYFVMELVKGRPITEYCDANQLSTKDRLYLFIQVCNAVQHAHQKGVIHRDLKPSNVMVTLHDGKPVPKVIDFGVSKALSHQLTDKTLFTRYGQIIGTPQYMSPEQAEMSGLDIDTRSDIYSLGVLLYELLTGQTPFDSETLRKAGLEGMRKLICESEPSKPSTKVKTLDGESATLVANRRSSAATDALSRSFSGDLDWIVMKSLDKDRSRRYETASNFVQDIERHLADEPVHAGPPSLAYQMSKLYRRHRGAFLSAAVVAAAIVVMTCFAFAGWIKYSALYQESVQLTEQVQAERDQNAKIINQLRLKIIDRALVYALNGDLELTERTVSELDLIAEDQLIAEIIRSQANLWKGDHEAAEIHAQKARRIDGNSYAALAAHALAVSSRRSDFRGITQESSKFEIENDLDRLFGAMMFDWVDPGRSLELIDSAGEMKDFAIANFHRSVAYGNHALLSRSMESARRSLEHAKIFQRQSNDSVLSATMNLYSRISMLLAAPEVDEQSLQEADEACENLRPYTDVYFAGRTRAWYLSLFGDPKAALAEWERRVIKNEPLGTDVGHFAAFGILQSQQRSVQDYLTAQQATLGDDPEFMLAAAYTAMLSDSEPSQVRKSCDKLLGNREAPANLKCEALGILLAKGDQSHASAWVSKLRIQYETLPKKILHTLDFVAGKTDAATFSDRIRKTAHSLECQILTVQPKFYIGLRQLGLGNRDTALKALKASLDEPCYFEGWFWWSKAIINSSLVLPD